MNISITLRGRASIHRDPSEQAATTGQQPANSNAEADGSKRTRRSAPPQPRRISWTREDEQSPAAGEEDGQSLKALVYVQLVDACLVLRTHSVQTSDIVRRHRGLVCV